MATVYKAFDPMFDREVALKVLPPELLHNPQFHKRFSREAKIVAKLEHAAIVPVYDVGEHNGQPFFVMRVMSGGSLADRLAQGPLSLEATASILKRISAGLDHAHKKNVIHRDLKPGNILFDEAGEPFLSDFGIAKLANLSQQTNLTGSGGIVGTAAYMSPEQAQGADVDYRSDIYALGIILYEMLSGKLPYNSQTPMGIAIKHITDPVPRILEDKPDLPDTVQAVIDKALAKDPEARYPSAASFAQAFERASRGEHPDLSAAALAPTRAVPKLQEPPAAQPAPQPSFWQTLFTKWRIAAVGLFLLLGIFFLAFNFLRPSQPLEALEAPDFTPLPSLAPAEIVPAASPTPQPEPVSQKQPGQAAFVAFVTANDIWVLDILENTSPLRLTTNRREKILFQWIANQDKIFYREAGCLYTLGMEGGEPQAILCARGSEIEGASISPDNSQIAVTLDRVLFILPFDAQALSVLQDRAAISRAATCSYNQVAAKSLQWSADGQAMAISYIALTSAGRKDVIRVLDISNCASSSPVAMQDFPADIFTPEGYDKNPTITTFHWDGQSRFLFNTFVRNDGYGQLYFYDMNTRQAQKLNPIDGVCCYRDARFSPDGTHLVFSFQDERNGLEARTQLFYLALDEALQGGQTFRPLNLPVDLLRIAREKPMLLLRPATELP